MEVLMIRCLVCAALLCSTTAFAGAWGKTEGTAWGKSTTEDATAAMAVGKRLSVGSPLVVGDTAVYPIIDREARVQPEADYVPLEAAMATGQVEVLEVANGVVPRLQVINRGKDPVFAMVGDIVRGGRQDRVITRDVILPPDQRPVALNVQCIEQGRWDHNGRFAYGGRVDTAFGEVIRRRRDQGATWAAIAQRNAAVGMPTDASWLASASSSDLQSIKELEASLKTRFQDDKRVVGVVVAHNGNFTRANVYPHPTLFAQDRFRLLDSHLRQQSPPAIARRPVPSTLDAAAFLEEFLADDNG